MISRALEISHAPLTVTHVTAELDLVFSGSGRGFEAPVNRDWAPVVNKLSDGPSSRDPARFSKSVCNSVPIALEGKALAFRVWVLVRPFIHDSFATPHNSPFPRLMSTPRLYLTLAVAAQVT